MRHNKKAETINYFLIRLIPLIIAVVALVIVVKFVFGSKPKDEEVIANSEVETIQEDSSELLHEETTQANTQETEDMELDNGTGADVNMKDLSVAISSSENADKTFGIDVAKWQGTIDWKQVADSGVQFAMIRVGFRTAKTGVITEDPTAKYNLQEAQAAGIKIGAYFFSSAVSNKEAVEEADWVADYIAQYAVTYPVAYNCEGFLSEENRQYSMTNAQRTDSAIAFMDEIANKGYYPMFYAAKNEMTDNIYWDMNRIDIKYKVWVSQYPSNPYPQTEKSDYTGTHAMWQYTNAGTVPGINKKTDIDIAYFGYSDIIAPKDSTAPEQVSANVEALMDFTEANETVTPKEVIKFRSEPTTTAENVKYQVENGDTARRTGICEKTGWSRVIYNGETLYAVSSYLTTDLNYKPASATTSNTVETVVDGVSIKTTFTSVNETVTAKEVVNLRSLPSVTNGSVKVVGSLNNGDNITRTGISNNGWSRLDYNGQAVYAVSSYLNVVQ